MIEAICMDILYIAGTCAGIALSAVFIAVCFYLFYRVIKEALNATE